MINKHNNINNEYNNTLTHYSTKNNNKMKQHTSTRIEIIQNKTKYDNIN